MDIYGLDRFEASDGINKPYISTFFILIKKINILKIMDNNVDKNVCE